MNARVRVPAALLAVLLGLVTACSSSTTVSDEAVSGEEGGAVEATIDKNDAQTVGETDLVIGGGESASGALGNQPDAGRKIIRTGDVTIRVDDVAAAADEVTKILGGVGAVLFSEETSLEFNPRSSLVFKLSPDEFNRAVDLLDPVGTIVGQRASSSDVTERVLDLRSRIATAEASVDRLRTFLGEATTVTDVAALEAELLGRETTLETLRAEVRNIESQVSQSTLSVELFSDEPPADFNVDNDLPGFLGGLSAGWSALVAFLAVLSAIVGFLIPFLPFIVGVVVLLSWLRRRAVRRSTKRATAGAPAAKPEPPTPVVAGSVGPTTPPPPRTTPPPPTKPQRPDHTRPTSPAD